MFRDLVFVVFGTIFFFEITLEEKRKHKHFVLTKSNSKVQGKKKYIYKFTQTQIVHINRYTQRKQSNKFVLEQNKVFNSKNLQILFRLV